MTPPLRKRLRFADSAAEARSDRSVMARALMYSFAAGAAIAVGSLGRAALPAVIAAGACLAVAALLLIGYDRLPRWTFATLVALGTALILASVRASGEEAYATLLALPAAYSAYFF